MLRQHHYYQSSSQTSSSSSSPPTSSSSSLYNRTNNKDNEAIDDGNSLLDRLQLQLKLVLGQEYFSDLLVAPSSLPWYSSSLLSSYPSVVQAPEDEAQVVVGGAAGEESQILLRPYNANVTTAAAAAAAAAATTSTTTSTRSDSNHYQRRRYLDLLILSDRKNNSAIPLKGLINSLLSHTTSPIHIHLVSDSLYFSQQQQRQQDQNITGSGDLWLFQLMINATPYFRVTLYPQYQLSKRAQQLINSTSLKLSHPSSQFAIQKMFLPELPGLQLSHANNTKILMMDDDQIFLEDITPLYQYIHQSPNSLSLLCTPDRFNIRKICTRSRKPHVPNNCHPNLYCVTGLIGFPIPALQQQSSSTTTTTTSTSSLVQDLEETTFQMMKEYPKFVATQADQDIFNRYFRGRFHYNNSQDNNIQLIPCEWSCGTDECGKDLFAGGGHNKKRTRQQRPRAKRRKQQRQQQQAKLCRNGCPINKCKAFHYQVKSFLQEEEEEEEENHTHTHTTTKHYSWKYYYEMNSMELLNNVFIPRIQQQQQQQQQQQIQ